MVSQAAALLVAVQTQVGAEAVKPSVPVPPDIGAASDEPPSVNEHKAAACDTEKTCSLIVTCAVRALVVVLASRVRPKVPLPLPLAPDVTVSHGASDVTVQAQPVIAVITPVAVAPPL